jgi:hypothetical protein
LAFLKKHHDDVNAMETALRKRASLGDKAGGMLASHPDPGKARRPHGRNGDQIKLMYHHPHLGVQVVRYLVW